MRHHPHPSRPVSTRRMLSRRVSAALVLALACACRDASEPVGPREPAGARGDLVEPGWPELSVQCGELRSGQELERGRSILTCNEAARLVVQEDQNIVLYDAAGASWHAPGTEGQGTTVLRMQGDGNLVASNAANQVLWTSGTQGHAGAWLAIQSDCNLVIYSGPYPAPGTVLWESNTPCRAVPPASGRMLPGDELWRDVPFTSLTGNARLVVQQDQNVVLYSGSTALWTAAGTAGSGTNRLAMQTDGNLVAYTRAGQPVWSTGTAGHPGAWTALQDDCNLVVYAGPYPAFNGVLYASGTATGSCGAGAGPPAPVNDYPYKTASTSSVDPWNFYFRQATSFAAWRIRTRTGATTFTNQYAGLSRWGNANEWDDAAQTSAAQAAGVTLQTQLAIGRVAQWEAGYHGASSSGGHVAYVADVYSDGSILVEEYNYGVALGYDSRRIYPGSNRWPSVFIQF